MYKNMTYHDAKEQLKSALFCQGLNVIQSVLDYRISPDEDKDVTDSRLDSALDQMSLNEFWELYEKYVA